MTKLNSNTCKTFQLPYISLHFFIIFYCILQFSEAARYVAQENVDEKSRLEVTTDHEHERHTFSKGQPSRKVAIAQML